MRTHAFSLVGTLVTMAVIAVLACVVYVGGLNYFSASGSEAAKPRPDGEGATIIGRSAAKARDHECQVQLGQVRAAISSFGLEDEQPTSLDQIGFPPSTLRCPIGQEPYRFNPNEPDPRLAVTCAHPGHERY